MTDAKSAPKATVKPAAKDENVKTAAVTGAVKAAGRGDVAEGQSVMERDDIGAAAGPGKPDKVKVITEVNPGTAN
jgi:hypothetical protein